ncbi:MAG: hypothetical protein LKJ83_00925 [Eubacteriaceae bacterium]|jgi:hypothetical protein|nr:hypothetical protein [Eubacteriaceae bacterium]
MSDNRKEINFYERFLYDPEAEAARLARRKALIPLCSLLGAVLLAFLIITGMTLVKNHQTANFKEYTSNNANQIQYQEAKAIEDQKNDALGQYNGLQDFKTQADSYSQASSALINEVEACVSSGTVTGLTFDSGNGVMTVSVTSKTASQAASMVRDLKKIAAFKKVSYDGYSGNGDEYTAVITCTYNK